MGGTLKVEMLDESGEVLKGYSLKESEAIVNDQYGATVQWQNGSDLSALRGKKVQLKFYLKGGDFYSYWFE